MPDCKDKIPTVLAALERDSERRAVVEAKLAPLRKEGWSVSGSDATIGIPGNPYVAVGLEVKADDSLLLRAMPGNVSCRLSSLEEAAAFAKALIEAVEKNT